MAFTKGFKLKPMLCLTLLAVLIPIKSEAVKRGLLSQPPSAPNDAASSPSPASAAANDVAASPAPSTANDATASSPSPAPAAANATASSPSSAAINDTDGGASSNGNTSNGAVFDVTTYGAKKEGKQDSTMAFIKAWREACKASGASKLLIPEGSFLTGETIFAGPCTANPMTIELRGTMLSDTDISLYSQNRWISIEHVDNLILTGTGTINGQGEASWSLKDKKSGNMLPDSISFMMVNHSKMENIKLVNSKGFHIKLHESSNFIVQNLTITAPANSPNTDGIHVSDCQNVNITDTKIGTGDDCVSIGDGNSNITVSKVVCGPGHGLSIGSLGKREGETDVKGILITNCTLSNTTNGARIKSYRESPKLSASGLIFDDIIMDNVENPIIIDQNYASKSKSGGSNVKISDVHFKNIRGTSATNVAVAISCSSSVPCEGVELVDIDLAYTGPVKKEYGASIVSICDNAKPTFTGKSNPAACPA